MAGESVDILNAVLANSHSLATHIGNLWSTWDTKRKPWKDRVADTIRYVFAESTRTTDNGGNFNNSTHRPKITQIYENLVANYASGLIPSKRFMKFENDTQEGYENKTQRTKLLAYLITKHRLAKFTDTMWDLIDDWVLYGNAFCFVYYTEEKPSEDNPWGQYELNYKGPKVERISPMDIVFNPVASSFQKSPKIVRRLTSLGELIRQAEDNPDDHWKLDIVEELKNQRTTMMGVSREDFTKTVQLQIDGFGSSADYFQSDVVEILELYGDIYDMDTQTLKRDRVITVADRRLVIRDEALKNWTGKPRLHHAGWRKRKDNLWAMGPLENLVGLQYRLNHLENARADAFDDMIYGDLVLKGDVQISSNPDGSKEYQISEGGDVHRLAPDTTILNAQLEIREIEAAMELYAGSPREAAGFRTPGEKTKFEVATLSNAASRIFQHKMTRFEVTMVEEILNSELMVAKEGMTGTDTAAMKTGEDGLQEYFQVSKQDLLVNGRVVPIGARHFARQQQLAQDLKDFQAVLSMDKELQQHFSSVKMGALWESVLDFEEYHAYQAYARIDEQTEMARRTQAAQQTLQNESKVPDAVDNGGVPGETTPTPAQ